VFGGAAGIVGASDDPQAAIACRSSAITGVALVAFLLATSLPGVDHRHRAAAAAAVGAGSPAS